MSVCSVFLAFPGRSQPVRRVCPNGQTAGHTHSYLASKSPKYLDLLRIIDIVACSELAKLISFKPGAEMANWSVPVMCVAAGAALFLSQCALGAVQMENFTVLIARPNCW